MQRTQIYLSSEQAEILDREAKRRGQTRSHLIREAIDRAYLADPGTEELLDAIESSFGAWTDRRETGEEYVDRIRSGNRLSELWSERSSDDDEADDR